MTTEETYKSLESELGALSEKVKSLIDSRELRGAFVTFEYADGIIYTTWIGR